MEYYSTVKKDGILPFATTWMDLESIMLNKISQMEKDRNHMIPFICGIYNRNQQTKQTHRHRQYYGVTRE